MWQRVTVLTLLIPFGMTVTARGDRLILNDGRILRGQVSVERGEDDTSRVYVIVTNDGQTHTFPRSEVKRSIHESSLSDFELLEKYEAWQDLVNPVLNEQEPDQREFMNYQRRYLSAYTIGNPSSVPTIERVRAVKRELIDSDSFVDRWARYTSTFKAVSGTLAYRQLTTRKKGSGSLWEYALYPPEGREEIAKALKWALESVDTCFRSAESTNNMIRNLPKERTRLERNVRGRMTSATKARNRVATARDAERRQEQARQNARRAAKKDSGVHQAIANLVTTMTRKTQDADTRINDFAQERTVARQHLVDAARHIEGSQERERGAMRRPRGESKATLLPSGPLTRAFRGIVSKHRSDAEGLTTLGLEALRQDTQSAVEGLFVGKEFSLRLNVENIYEAGADGYAVKASHRSGFGEPIVRMVEFNFGGEVRYRLIKCKVNDEIEVDARIRRAAIKPDLPALENSNETASVHLSGDIVTVRSGCGAH